MPLNYASVDKNASQYAQQAQDWLLECKKIAGQLNTLYDEAVSDPERLRQMNNGDERPNRPGRTARAVLDTRVSAGDGWCA